MQIDYRYCGCTVHVCAAGYKAGRCGRCGERVVWMMGEDRRLSLEGLLRMVDRLT